MGITDEVLMAYADGELTASEAADVERAMAEDETLAERAAVFADGRTALKRAFGAAPAVSTDLEARIRAMAEADVATRQTPVSQGNVVDLASRRRVVPFWQMPVAATIALAIGAGSVWLATGGGRSMGGLEIAGLADPSIFEALTTLPSGERLDLGSGMSLATIATFRDGTGTLCREFEHVRERADTVVAVACRTDESWDIRFAIAAASPDTTGYSPASSLETLDAYLTATEAGAPLSAEDEAAALGALD